MDRDEPVPGIPGAVFRRVAWLAPELPESVRVDANVQAKPGALQFSAPGIGIFLGRGGNVVEYALEPDADPGAVNLLLHGTARGALIHQRGELPLHAATLVPPGGEFAVAICGVSGAGKSTLGAALSRRGWALVADDTTRVVFDGANVIAWPSRDTIKLWRDACEAAAIDISTLERVTRTMDKYYVPAPSSGREIPLGMIVELTSEPGSTTLSTGHKMALVSRNTYRSGHILPLGMQAEHARIVARTVATCSIFQLTSDRSLPLDSLVDAVETAIRK